MTDFLEVEALLTRISAYRSLFGRKVETQKLKSSVEGVLEVQGRSGRKEDHAGASLLGLEEKAPARCPVRPS